MAFTPTNFLEGTRALDQVAQEATSHRNLMDQGIRQLEQAASRLQAMGTDWSAAATFIDDQAAANPTDEDWQSLKARKDKMVADFASMRDLSISVRDAATTARG